MSARAIAAAVVSLACLASPGRADWDVGQPFKMHFPQLPDPNGWDVRATYYTGVADDFLCTETGLIRDFHIWTSRKADEPVLPEDIEFIHTAIYADVPDPDGNGPAYSMPGERLWHHDWKLAPAIGTFTVRPYATGEQGWYDPLAGLVVEKDHLQIDQWNFFIDPLFAFEQEAGTVYWLEIAFKLAPGAIEDGKRIGWKTSLDHFNDDAVCREIVDGEDPVWTELYDPLTGVSLDMAFVITPEPGALAILVFGGLAILGRRRRHAARA